MRAVLQAVNVKTEGLSPGSETDSAGIVASYSLGNRDRLFSGITARACLFSRYCSTTHIMMLRALVVALYRYLSCWLCRGGDRVQIETSPLSL